MPDYDSDVQQDGGACYPSSDGGSTGDGGSCSADGGATDYQGDGGADPAAAAAPFAGMYDGPDGDGSQAYLNGMDGAGGASGGGGDGASGANAGSGSDSSDKSWWQDIKDWWYGEPKAPADDPRADTSDIRCADPNAAVNDPANCGPTIGPAVPYDPNYMTPQQRLEFMRNNPIGGAAAGMGMMAGQDPQSAVQRANRNMAAVQPIIDAGKMASPKITPYKRDSSSDVQWGPRNGPAM